MKIALLVILSAGLDMGAALLARGADAETNALEKLTLEQAWKLAERQHPDLAEARYASGDTSLSEVVPVRREWSAVQLTYLESVRDVMQAWVQLQVIGKTP